MASDGSLRGKTRLGGPAMDLDNQRGKPKEKKPSDTDGIASPTTSCRKTINMCIICKIRPAKRRYCKGCSFIVSDARSRRQDIPKE